LRNNLLKFKNFRKITYHSRGICGIYPRSIKKKLKDININNRLDLETLGSQLIMSKNLLGLGLGPGLGLGLALNIMPLLHQSLRACDY